MAAPERAPPPDPPRLGRFFQDWDVLLCPVIATRRCRTCQDGATWERRLTVNGREIAYNDLLFWPGMTCAFHLPATVAPIGFTKAGLPIGVQIVGPLYGDRMTIAVAKMLEAEWQGFVPPPGFDSSGGIRPAQCTSGLGPALRQK